MPGKPVTDGPAHPRRPAGVTVASWLHLLQCLLLSGAGLYYLRSAGVLAGLRGVPALDALLLLRAASTGGVFVTLALPTLVVAIGLFLLRRWAWLLGIAMQGMVLASALLAYALHRPNYILMVTGILLVLSLNQGDVRRAFVAREVTSHA